MPLTPWIVASLVALTTAGCTTSTTADAQPLSESERAAIADTVRRINREAGETFDSDLDCAEIVDRLSVPGGGNTFVAQGRIIDPGGRDEMVGMCRMIKQDRLSAHTEIQDETVEVVSKDAAYVVTSSVYTVRFKDGRTMVRPQVVTTVWARRGEGWQRAHLHESWQTDGQPGTPSPDTGTAR
jgi:ketosteroid isomerase-like protein